LGVSKPGALHPATPAPIKALSCFCFFPPMAEKSKPPALRLVGDSKKEELYECTGHLEEQKTTKSAYQLI